MSALRLQLTIAARCEAGGKESNEDAVAYELPEDPHRLTYKGAVLALADGVSSAEAGRDASHTAVQSFVQDYLTTPDTWSVKHSAEQVLSTINLRLYRRSHAYHNQLKGHLCTFSAVVVKSHTAYFFHIGDSRIYLLRAGDCHQLTTDHSTELQDKRQFLVRALGMDSDLRIDFGRQQLQSGDLLLLSTDGLHDFIRPEQFNSILAQPSEPDELAEQLYQLALQQGSDDNISVIIARVDVLPIENIDDYSERLTRLPFPPALQAGMKVDGYRIERELYASNRSHLYLVTDEASGQQLVMKSPSVNYADDAHYIDRFIKEEWIGSRIQSPNVVKVIRQNRARSFLYYLLEYVEGQSLERWMQQHHPVKPSQAIKLAGQIAQGLQAFHDCEAIHQDLKPGNILITADEQVKIVDFGSVFVAGVAEVFIPLDHDAALGTACYSDPQYLMGHNSGIQGDVYALATICYELFTGQLPYGEKIEDCRSASDFDRLRYISARQHNPRIPMWFDRALEKGVAFDLQQRYTTLQSLLRDLKQPNPEFLRDEVKRSTRTSSLLFWQLLSGFWFVTLLLVIWLFLLQR
ncbi:MAG: protein phosphatase 2C domain-containing protein [Alkalimonas sp.]|nr:protein phosphatase 2C domain-containing protein [Alkalimonas sp.]